MAAWAATSGNGGARRIRSLRLFIFATAGVTSFRGVVRIASGDIKDVCLQTTLAGWQ